MSSDHEAKMANLTRQMRHNQSDLQSFLSDMDSWESDIKKKEEKLLSGKSEKDGSLPPVRNTIHKKKLKKKKKEKVVDPNKKQKIPGHDFRAWDKFDVDAALDDIDTEEKKNTSSSEYETDEEWEIERKKHLSGIEKDKGNTFFKNGDYDRAVEAYSRGIEFDSTNAVLPANRAMALLKQQKYGAAELDCTSSISLDPLYVKAYLRRATARGNLGKHKEAIEDYNRVLDLEPTNKMAQTELERLQKEKERDEKAAVPSTLADDGRGVVKAIYKSPDERSKVPLKRIVIEEIGIETVKRNQQPLTQQSDITKKITERENKNFENLIANSQTSKVTDSATNGYDSTRNPLSSTSFSTPNGSSNASKNPKISELATKDNQKLPNYVQDTDSSHKKKTESKTGQARIGNIGEPKRKSDRSTASQPSSDQRNTSNTSNGICQDSSVPGIPQSSFQFQTDFKMLKNKTQSFFTYFTAIQPCQYPILFGQCLDADILKTILKSLLDYGPQASDVNVYDVLLGMTNVRRFSMTAMFLSPKEKQCARELMEHIKSTSLCSDEELVSLRKKYDL